MKTLQVRPHSKPKRARVGYVQVYIDGRWRANRAFYLTCNRWEAGTGYACPVHDNPSLDNVEFVMLEDDADCEVAASQGVKPWSIAYGDVFRRCKQCRKLFPTGYGYRPKGSSIPLAHATCRWASQ